MGYYRKASESGVYHVMIRPVAKQLLFENDEDYQTFVKILAWALEHYECELYAYCLMDNHVHLLLKSPDGKPSAFMAKLQELYARYFNAAYHRQGSLFQPRFRSKPIDTDTYLLAALRYVLNNPKDTGVADYREYPWSSYREYVALREVPQPLRITNTSFVKNFFDGADAFAKFVAGANNQAKGSAKGRQAGAAVDADSYYAYSRLWKRPKMGDKAALKLLKNISGVKSAADVAGLPKEQRNEVLRELHQRGVSANQLSQLTGVSIATVYRIVR